MSPSGFLLSLRSEPASHLHPFFDQPMPGLQAEGLCSVATQLLASCGNSEVLEKDMVLQARQGGSMDAR